MPVIIIYYYCLLLAVVFAAPPNLKSIGYSTEPVFSVSRSLLQHSAVKFNLTDRIPLSIIQIAIGTHAHKGLAPRQ